MFNILENTNNILSYYIFIIINNIKVYLDNKKIQIKLNNKKKVNFNDLDQIIPNNNNLDQIIPNNNNLDQIIPYNDDYDFFVYFD